MDATERNGLQRRAGRERPPGGTPTQRSLAPANASKPRRNAPLSTRRPAMPPTSRSCGMPRDDAFGPFAAARHGMLPALGCSGTARDGAPVGLPEARRVR
eukprot:362014-Chlamydomonas_euryale.AAC.4